MFLKRFFYYPKSDRRGMALLIGIIVILGAVFVVIKQPFTSYNEEYKEASENYHRGYYHRYYKWHQWSNGYQHRAPAELFQFDPNTATAEDFVHLGLYDWQARNIMKYRAKGGKFHKPADFAKIYGLSQKQFAQLEPYIYIGDEFRYADRSEQRDSAPRVFTHYENMKIKEGENVLLNSADTSDLKRVPGIGSYYARKIVQYRERLGGFVSARQVEEIDGVPASAVKFLKVDASDVKRININTATVRQMSLHPYISYAQAKQIEGFRRMKGRLHSKELFSFVFNYCSRLSNSLKSRLNFFEKNPNSRMLKRLL
jgi:DNA uptake protein ComE-like DNA-binding protein